MTLPLEWRVSISGTQQVISELQKIRQEYNSGQITLQEYSEKSRYLSGQLRQVNNSFNQQRNILLATHPALQTFTRGMATFGHVASSALSIMNALNIASLNTNSQQQALYSSELDLIEARKELNRLSQAGLGPGDILWDLQKQKVEELTKAVEANKKAVEDAARQNQMTMITSWITIATSVGSQITSILVLFKIMKTYMSRGIDVPIRYNSVGAPVGGAGLPVPPTGGLPGGGGLGSAVAGGVTGVIAGTTIGVLSEPELRKIFPAFDQWVQWRDKNITTPLNDFFVKSIPDFFTKTLPKFFTENQSIQHTKGSVQTSTSNMDIMEDLGTVYIKNSQILDNNTKNISDLGMSVLKQYEQYKIDNPKIIRASDQLILTNEQLIESQTQVAQNIDDLIKKGIPINVIGGGKGGGSSGGGNPLNPYKRNYPGYRPGLPEDDIGAASGFEGIITKPTTFLTGEAGPEMVSITPLSKMGGEKQTIIINNYITGSLLALNELEKISDRALKINLKRAGFG